jgi:hypothetical protein
MTDGSLWIPSGPCFVVQNLHIIVLLEEGQKGRQSGHMRVCSCAANLQAGPLGEFDTDPAEEGWPSDVMKPPYSETANSEGQRELVMF